MRVAKIVLISILILLVVIQLIPVDRSVPETDPEDHILAINVPSDDVHHILKTACLDCHSYETRYPWYSNVAPISWWLQNHIEHAREELNFSTWASYDPEDRSHMLKESIDLVRSGNMPLSSYKLIHREADLNADQKQLLTSWFSSVQNGQGANTQVNKSGNGSSSGDEYESDEEDDD